MSVSDLLSQLFVVIARAREMSKKRSKNDIEVLCLRLESICEEVKQEDWE